MILSLYSTFSHGYHLMFLPFYIIFVGCLLLFFTFLFNVLATGFFFFFLPFHCDHPLQSHRLCWLIQKALLFLCAVYQHLAQQSLPSLKTLLLCYQTSRFPSTLLSGFLLLCGFFPDPSHCPYIGGHWCPGTLLGSILFCLCPLPWVLLARSIVLTL